MAYKTMVLVFAGLGILSLLVDHQIAAAGAYIAAGLSAIADALVRHKQ